MARTTTEVLKGNNLISWPEYAIQVYSDMMKCPCTHDHGQALKHWKLAYTQYKWQMEVKQATDYFLKNVILHLSTSTNACLHSLLSLSNTCSFLCFNRDGHNTPSLYCSCFLLLLHLWWAKASGEKTRPLTEEHELTKTGICFWKHFYLQNSLNSLAAVSLSQERVCLCQSLSLFTLFS